MAHQVLLGNWLVGNPVLHEHHTRLCSWPCRQERSFGTALSASHPVSVRSLKRGHRQVVGVSNSENSAIPFNFDLQDYIEAKVEAGKLRILQNWT